jgi:hypothetical protein
MTRAWSCFYSGFSVPSSLGVAWTRVQVNMLYYQDNYVLLVMAGLFLSTLGLVQNIGTCLLLLIAHPLLRQRHFRSHAAFGLQKLQIAASTATTAPMPLPSSSTSNSSLSFFTSHHPAPPHRHPILPLNRDSPRWQPDSSTSTCALCSSVFTLLRRRHHCRTCGHIICSSCSSHTLVKHRVCDRCPHSP